MHRQHRRIALITGSLLLIAVGAWARTVYVNTRYAKVRESQASTAAQVGKVDFGDGLTVVTDQGGFLQVSVPNGKVGWIAKMWVSDTAPSKDGLAEKAGQSVRAGGTVTYTAGARGLTDEAKTYASSKSMGDAAAAVEKMEKFQVTDEDLEQFMRAAHLGDFRGGQR